MGFALPLVVSVWLLVIGIVAVVVLASVVGAAGVVVYAGAARALERMGKASPRRAVVLWTAAALAPVLGFASAWLVFFPLTLMAGALFARAALQARRASD